MVGLAASSVVFLAAGEIFFRGVDLSAYFFRNAATMEQVSDGITQLSALMPQIVRIHSCHCSGNGDTEADCTWDGSNTANEWKDPVLDFGQASPVTIFDADYENGFGGGAVNPGTLFLGSDPTLTSFYSGMGCEDPNPSGVAANRGCRRRMRLVYTAPTQMNAGTGTLSKPGTLEIQLRSTLWGGSMTTLRIGATTDTGSSRGGQVGLVKLSCGFASPVAGQLGTDFVINLRTKVKSNTIEDPGSTRYESWYPKPYPNGEQHYQQGLFREAKLRFSFLNLTNRGAYQWKLQSVRNCKKAGESVTSREQCCSLAYDSSGQCLDSCKPSGTAGGISECCSEKSDGTTCK